MKKLTLQLESFKKALNTVAPLAIDSKSAEMNVYDQVQIIGKGHDLEFYTFDGQHVCFYKIMDPESNFAAIDIRLDAKTLQNIANFATSDTIEITVLDKVVKIQEGLNTYDLAHGPESDFSFMLQNLAKSRKVLFSLKFGDLKKYFSILKICGGKTAKEQSSISSTVFYDGNFFVTNLKTCVIINHQQKVKDFLPIAFYSLDLLISLDLDYDTELNIYDQDNIVIVSNDYFAFTLRKTDINIVNYSSALPELKDMTHICSVDNKELRQACNKIVTFTNPLNFNSCHITFEDDFICFNSGYDNKVGNVRISYIENLYKKNYEITTNIKSFMRNINCINAPNIDLHVSTDKRLYCLTDDINGNKVYIYESLIVPNKNEGE